MTLLPEPPLAPDDPPRDFEPILPRCSWCGRPTDDEPCPYHEAEDAEVVHLSLDAYVNNGGR